MPNKKILLSTAIVLLRDILGTFVPGRILLNSGLQSNLITEQMAQALKLKRKRMNHKLCSVGNNTQHVTSAVNTIALPKHTNFTLFASCLVVKRITNNIPVK